MQLTILTDEHCKEIGTVAADNLGNEQVVNVRKELCGAFVNKLNVTYVNYTQEQTKEQDQRFKCFFKNADFFMLFHFSYAFSKIDLKRELEKKQSHGLFR